MPPARCHATFSCLRHDLLSLPAHILSTLPERNRFHAWVTILQTREQTSLRYVLAKEYWILIDMKWDRG